MIFNEQDHTYTKDGKTYMPVGDFIGKFKKPFPKKAIASKKAKKEGKDPEYFIEKWRLNADVSINYGNAAHKAIEYWTRFGEIHKIPHIGKLVKAFSKKYDREKISSEIIVYDDDNLIAGTIDTIESLGNKEINLVDLKTNYNLKKKANGYFLDPISHIRDSKLNEYRLKMSMYKYLAELKGLKVKELKLEHWKDGELITVPINPFDDIEKLLNYEKSKTKSKSLNL